VARPTYYGRDMMTNATIKAAGYDAVALAGAASLHARII
jgi:hypothetical protein